MSGDERRLYGGEFDEHLAMQAALRETFVQRDHEFWHDGEPYDGTDFVEWSVHHPTHHLPTAETLLEWVQVWAAENGQTAEDWELGGGESDTKAAEAFLAKLADGVTYMMANEVVARHRIELRGRQPFLDGEPYGEPIPPTPTRPTLPVKRMVEGELVDQEILPATHPDREGKLMTEITHAMQAALRETFVQRDHELRERALRLVAPPRPLGDGRTVRIPENREWVLTYAPMLCDTEFWHDGQVLGATLWRLLDRLDGAPSLEEFESLQELVDQQATLLAGYREALANITDDAPHNGSETSKAAARSIAPRMNPMRVSILAALIRADPQGLTADEIERCTGMTGNSIRPRLVEMETLTWVVRDGDTRETRSGRPASVWRVTEKGSEVFTAAAHEASTTPS